MDNKIKVSIWGIGCGVIIVFMIFGYQIIQNNKTEYRFSSNILFSINNGAAGFGTIADCTDAEIVVYTDRTVRVFMCVEGNPEIMSVTLTEEEYAKLSSIASPQEICRLKVREDYNVCDGNSSDITLYDENDEKLMSRGGYMVEGKKYHEIYNGVKEILAPYGIEKKVEEYRDFMREEDR